MTEKKKEGLAKTTRPIFEQMAVTAKDAFCKVMNETLWLVEIGFALQILRGNEIWERVAKENPNSIRDAVINVALTRTTLNPARKQAYLVPRKIKGKMSCCLDFGYQGLVNILIKGGGVLDMDATCVYENDEFDYCMGLKPDLHHKPTEGERGKFRGVYAKVILASRIDKFIYLTAEDVEKVRKSSPAPDSPMWKNWYGEGARKTAVKKLYKLCPQSEAGAVAIEVLNAHEGLDKKALGGGSEKAKELDERFPSAPAEVEPEEEKPPVKKKEQVKDPTAKKLKDDMLLIHDIGGLEAWRKDNEVNINNLPAEEKSEFFDKFHIRLSELKNKPEAKAE